MLLAAIALAGAALIGATAAPGRPGLRAAPPPPGETNAAGTGVSVLQDHTPAVTHLNPRLLSALKRAAAAAARDGVAFHVNSGWRSAADQEQLLRAAVSQYGSRAAAARWVATPEKSLHVSGRAVDVGPPEAAAWLSAHGARYGLCRVYRNEPWHYEWRREAATRGCPPLYADPTQDPRLQ